MMKGRESYIVKNCKRSEMTTLSTSAVALSSLWRSDGSKIRVDWQPWERVRATKSWPWQKMGCRKSMAVPVGLSVSPWARCIVLAQLRVSWS
jgi:hypothetical protein